MYLFIFNSIYLFRHVFMHLYIYMFLCNFLSSIHGRRFTPAQTNRPKGGNRLWYGSTWNEAGVKGWAPILLPYLTHPRPSEAIFALRGSTRFLTVALIFIKRGHPADRALNR